MADREPTADKIESAAAIAPLLRSFTGCDSLGRLRFSRNNPVKAEPQIVLDLADLDLTDFKVCAQTIAAKINGADIDCIKINELGYFYKEAERRRTGRLGGKVALITGAAQGFGAGIARQIAAAGAYVIIADIKEEKAAEVASSLNSEYGADAAEAIYCDVTSEASVQQLIFRTITGFGGIDILVSNAGILVAGGLEELSLPDFELVTKVNYTAFYLMARYAVRPMRVQAAVDPAYSADIIQINSKSGLEGSNRNFAYAGSKFGGIGLVQSFARELVEDRIKVNAICPGNYYDGPLWSDPEKGLFIQYLRSGKVPGAATVQDVRSYYENRVPMRRGCTPEDVTRAVLYCVEQQYETGQAIPVTGGQVMLS